MRSLPAEPREFAVWTRLVRAADAARATVETALKKSGFPPLSWYDVLLELSRAPDEGLRPSELEQKLLLPQYNLSRLVDRIVRAGYAQKTVLPEDRRGHFLSITPQGRQLIGRMWPAYRSAVERHFGSNLSPPDMAMLTHLLDRLRNDSGDTAE